MKTKSPVEILTLARNTGINKMQRKISSVLILAFLAGAFIAFAAEGSTMAAHNLLANPATTGLARTLSGAIFAAGLIMVLMAGGELFTGNMLIIIPVLDREVSVRRMLANWLLVYIGNMAGCLLIAWMMNRSGLFSASDGLLGGIIIKIAAGKTQLAFFTALILGVMCNWLVCLAIWASYASRGAAGKVLIIFFIITLFIISGFEHSVANMYYIPVGIFAKQNPLWASMSTLSAEQLGGLNWFNYFVKNLMPVTLGNIIGGAGMVGTLYWVGLREKGS